MKKDDIILIRIVSVAVLLAALALIIVFGVRISFFDSICDEIYLGNITDKNRTYKVSTSGSYGNIRDIRQSVFGGVYSYSLDRSELCDHIVSQIGHIPQAFAVIGYGGGRRTEACNRR